MKVAVEQNVVVQIENLRTHPAVAAALSRNELQLHAWVYMMETGEVSVYDPVEARFRPIADDNRPNRVKRK